jgi:hypothetical protein
VLTIRLTGGTQLVTTILKMRWEHTCIASFFMGTDISAIVGIIRNTYHRRQKVPR